MTRQSDWWPQASRICRAVRYLRRDFETTVGEVAKRTRLPEQTIVDVIGDGQLYLMSIRPVEGRPKAEWKIFEDGL